MNPESSRAIIVRRARCSSAQRLAALVISLACAATVTVAQATTVTLLGYRTTVPREWMTRAPASSMRLAEFVVLAPGGAASAEIVVYFFGKGQGGTAASNLDRWKKQFSMPDGSAVPETITRDSAGAFPITFAEYRGTYARGIGAGSTAEEARPGQTLLAAIAETPNGTMFIQLFGPTAGAMAQREAFLRFVRGLRESKPG